MRRIRLYFDQNLFKRSGQKTNGCFSQAKSEKTERNSLKKAKTFCFYNKNGERGIKSLSAEKIF
ncbi:hypothetical protein BB776_02275 [Planococcus salinarum]|uniref:Uncharacterized protein n=1 Tax=Planococcus salinarum TaxID=622695 RepID=A0ABX3D252_9BACL|nr:hypothetical protein BB776_02275 [Planococcus salinarum]